MRQHNNIFAIYQYERGGMLIPTASVFQFSMLRLWPVLFRYDRSNFFQFVHHGTYIYYGDNYIVYIGIKYLGNLRNLFCEPSI